MVLTWISRLLSFYSTMCPSFVSFVKLLDRLRSQEDCVILPLRRVGPRTKRGHFLSRIEIRPLFTRDQHCQYLEPTCAIWTIELFSQYIGLFICKGKRPVDRSRCRLRRVQSLSLRPSIPTPPWPSESRCPQATLCVERCPEASISRYG